MLGDMNSCNAIKTHSWIFKIIKPKIQHRSLNKDFKWNCNGQYKLINQISNDNKGKLNPPLTTQLRFMSICGIHKIDTFFHWINSQLNEVLRYWNEIIFYYYTKMTYMYEAKTLMETLWNLRMLWIWKDKKILLTALKPSERNNNVHLLIWNCSFRTAFSK